MARTGSFRIRRSGVNRVLTRRVRWRSLRVSSNRSRNNSVRKWVVYRKLLDDTRSVRRSSTFISLFMLSVVYTGVSWILDHNFCLLLFCIIILYSLIKSFWHDSYVLFFLEDSFITRSFISFFYSYPLYFASTLTDTGRHPVLSIKSIPSFPSGALKPHFYTFFVSLISTPTDVSLVNPLSFGVCVYTVFTRTVKVPRRPPVHRPRLRVVPLLILRPGPQEPGSTSVSEQSVLPEEYFSSRWRDFENIVEE